MCHRQVDASENLLDLRKQLMLGQSTGPLDGHGLRVR